MFDQLIIGNKASYDDFEASVAERKNIKPKKKSIKESVPFSNVTHDFSAINGEIYWEDRNLEYVFEITANSPEELEVKKQPFISWIMNVMNEELYDPFIPDYHFIATFSEIDEDDSEIEKSTITVKFTAYPYMISNHKKTCPFNITATEATVTIYNDSSHRITPTVITDVECIIKKGNSSYGVPAGEITDSKFALSPGKNTLAVKSTSGNGTIEVEFYEEVF
jgi:hypothetical protein